MKTFFSVSGVAGPSHHHHRLRFGFFSTSREHKNNNNQRVKSLWSESDRMGEVITVCGTSRDQSEAHSMVKLERPNAELFAWLLAADCGVSADQRKGNFYTFGRTFRVCLIFIASHNMYGIRNSSNQCDLKKTIKSKLSDDISESGAFDWSSRLRRKPSQRGLWIKWMNGAMVGPRDCCRRVRDELQNDIKYIEFAVL